MEKKITLFLSRRKALALLSSLFSSLDEVKKDVILNSYDPYTVELWGYLNAVADDLLEQLGKGTEE